MLSKKPKVELISYSKPASYLTDEHLQTCQDLIAYCARVSNPSNQLNTSTEGLIKYLLKHKHFSPFEMVSACLEINTTRDIGRQILRHRSFSFQEFSQRYADPTKDLTFVTREARLQDTSNRQNSIEVDDLVLAKKWEEKQKAVIEMATLTYAWAIDNGIAKEQARCVLPEGNTTTRMYMSGTLRSWLHYLELRTGVDTQKEHREVAIECAIQIAKVMPLILSMVHTKEVKK